MEGGVGGGTGGGTGGRAIVSPLPDGDAAKVAAACAASLGDRGGRRNERRSTRPISGPGRWINVIKFEEIHLYAHFGCGIYCKNSDKCLV